MVYAYRARALVVVTSAALLLPLTATPLSTQTRPEPRLIFSVFGGVLRGGHLWLIDKQPLSRPFGTLEYDTLRLNRRLTTAPIAGLNATFYQSGSWGLTAEVTYLGMRHDDDCETVFAYPDLQNRTQQMCDDVTQRTRTSSIVLFSAGGALRLAPRSLVSPYLRLQGGIAIRSGSLVETKGRYVSDDGTGAVVIERIVLRDESEVTVSPGFAAVAGLMIAVSPGYQLRVEVRDHLVFLQRPTGPGVEGVQVETERTLDHVPALVIGFDIVLEQRRGRRY